MRKIVFFILYLLITTTPLPAIARENFTDWLTALRIEALAKGISTQTFDHAMAGVKPIDRVIELDRRQPEFTQTFWRYLDIRVSRERIDRGRLLLEKHHALLNEIYARYGVQPRFLVAFWGLETNFGDYLGSFSVIGSLATLAYDERRSSFFRSELLAALTILEDGHTTPEAMKGSWAGAMGQPQFMPSTFVRFAVDHDGDGRRDIWHSLPDVFASAANFLASSGWQADKTWGREVQLPKGFDLDLAGLSSQRLLAEWQETGVRRMDGRDLPDVAIKASLVLPSGHDGPAFLVYQNFRTILNWNRSNLYAVAVGHLADRLAGQGPLLTKRPESDEPLSRDQVIEIQQLLSDRGYYLGTADGIAGSQTRTAIKKFQRQFDLPADGHPSPVLLKKLKTAM